MAVVSLNDRCLDVASLGSARKERPGQSLELKNAGRWPRQMILVATAKSLSFEPNDHMRLRLEVQKWGIVTSKI